LRGFAEAGRCSRRGAHERLPDAHDEAGVDGERGEARGDVTRLRIRA